MFYSRLLLGKGVDYCCFDWCGTPVVLLACMIFQIAMYDGAINSLQMG